MSGAVFAIPDQTLTSRQISLSKAMNDVATEESTTSTSFTDLSTSGASIALSTGVVQSQHIIHGGKIRDAVSTCEGIIGISLSLATPSDNDVASGVAVSTTPNFGIRTRALIVSNVTSGATHRQKYKVTGSTGLFSLRRVVGISI